MMAFASKLADNTRMTSPILDVIAFLNFHRDNMYDFDDWDKTHPERILSGMKLVHALKAPRGHQPEGNGASADAHQRSSDAHQRSFLFRTDSTTGKWKLFGGITFTFLPDGHMIRHEIPTTFSSKPLTVSFTRRGKYVLDHEEEELILKTHQGLVPNEELAKSQYIMFSPRDMYKDFKQLAKIYSQQPGTPAPTWGSSTCTQSSKSNSFEGLGWTDIWGNPDED
jgi:hypothetical protein